MPRPASAAHSSLDARLGSEREAIATRADFAVHDLAGAHRLAGRVRDELDAVVAVPPGGAGPVLILHIGLGQLRANRRRHRGEQRENEFFSSVTATTEIVPF